MKQAGYSETPLIKKLGLKEKFDVSVYGAPSFFVKMLQPFNGMNNSGNKKIPKDYIHFFVNEADLLNAEIKNLKEEIKQDGMIWISWPKKSSKVPTDITEDVIRIIALKNGLVDIKVCAINETWSGLKLVIPVKERKK